MGLGSDVVEIPSWNFGTQICHGSGGADTGQGYFYQDLFAGFSLPIEVAFEASANPFGKIMVLVESSAESTINFFLFIYQAVRCHRLAEFHGKVEGS